MTAILHIRIRAFAAARECLGTDSATLQVPAGATVADAMTALARNAPGLPRLPLAYAVNRDYARSDRVLQDGDELALIPPISGGGGRHDLCRFELQHGPIDVRALEAEVRTDQDGAVVTFSGVTRDHHEGAAVLLLAYEAYEEMAQRVMAGVFEQTLARYPVTRVRVVHRLGEVPIGEASVVVTVSSPHRGPAFEACRYLMDRLKHEVPIFKRETLQGGATRWVGDLPQG